MKSNLFKNLKRNMEMSSKFQDIDFSKESRKKVMQKIDNISKRKKYPKWKLTFNVAISFFILFGISYFGFEHLFVSEPNPPNADETTQLPSDNNRSEINSDMRAKQEVKELLRNSEENFSSAKGVYSTYIKTYSRETIIDFEMNMKNPSGGYEKAVQDDGSKYYTYIDENYIWDLDLQHKTYFKTEKDDTTLNFTSSILFTDYIANTYLQNEENWNIEEVQSIVGRDALYITGTLNDYNTEAYGIHTYEFWVDKETGILLKYKLYSLDGNVTSSLTVKEISLNTNLKEIDYTPNIEGYKKE
ncbi:LolA-like protein [Aquibacillus kalidii]|uniref:hypothetical protein n=1 Tax=Aquibacillus kalidii TaxID=2762597 RepID=UPI0016469FBF|nr:hypothetical protein [Aquibacillus kalidii]